MKAKKNQFTIIPLELCDDNDNVVEVIQVRSDYISMRNRLLESLGRLQKLSEANASDDELGNAVLDLMGGIYGEDGTKRIVTFFENNYTAHITVVTSHIYEDILPALNRLLEEKHKQAKAYGQYKGKR